MRATRTRAQRGRVRRRRGRRAAAAAQQCSRSHASRSARALTFQEGAAAYDASTPCALKGFSLAAVKGGSLVRSRRYAFGRTKKRFALLSPARGPDVVIPRTARAPRRVRSWRAVQTRVRQRPRSTALPLRTDDRQGVCRGACAASRPAQGAYASSRMHASARSLHASQIFIAAGEPSGDVLAARVMAALRAAAPCAVDFCGVGGCARLPSWSLGCASLTAAHQATYATGALAAGVSR
jgi:hypothetical protein